MSLTLHRVANWSENCYLLSAVKWCLEVNLLTTEQPWWACCYVFFSGLEFVCCNEIYYISKLVRALWFLAKTNLFVWNTSAKVFFLIRINPPFSVPRRNFKNSSKTPSFLLHDRVWGEWVQQLLWRLPRKIEYLPSSHFLEDDAKHIRKVRKNAFQRCYRLLQQYPRFKERYTVQFNGDDRSIVQ